MSSRADRLARRLEDKGLDLMVVTTLVNVRYLSGYTGSNGIALVGPDLRVFFTDFRYVEQVASEGPDFERVKGERDLLGDVAQRMRGRVGFEDGSMTVRA